MPNFTIYIKKDDLDRWKALENKSEFISNALNRVPIPNYKKTPSVAPRRVGPPASWQTARIETKDPEKGYPCCQSKKRCKHWEWDSGEASWLNSITGEVKDE